MNNYDLVVIGTGAGNTILEAALTQGLKCAVIERGKFGGGNVYLGGVMFRTADERDACRAENGKKWVPGENYLVFEEFERKSALAMTFRRISYCAGVIILTE